MKHSLNISDIMPALIESYLGMVSDDVMQMWEYNIIDQADADEYDRVQKIRRWCEENKEADWSSIFQSSQLF